VRWKIGDGKTIRFWEDIWFGTCSLAIQFWDLYVLSNQKNVSVAEVWDGEELKISFRRRISLRLMQKWLDLVAIAESVNYNDDCDAIVWSFADSNSFSVQAVYKTINFRGVQPVYTPNIWGLNVPPRIHIFLWLLSNNKTLTRTNLAKRRHVEDVSCLFCNEPETVNHLFFFCCVAKVLWSYLKDIFHTQLGDGYESVARWWISDSKHKVMNGCSAALMWSLWKFRNAMCFQGKSWMGEKILIRRLLHTLKNWRTPYSEADVVKLDQVLARLLSKLEEPLQLTAPPQMNQSSSISQMELMSSLEATPGRAIYIADMPLEAAEAPVPMISCALAPSYLDASQVVSLCSVVP